MQQIFESYTLKNTIDYGDTNPCTQPLGFAHQLLSIVGYDPMKLSAFFSGIQRITNALGMMPISLKAYDESDIPENHWFNSLFDNCIQTPFIFVKQIIKDCITQGNGYALIQRKNGIPVNLIYLPAGTCSTIIDTQRNRLVYNVSYNGKISKQYESKDIIHVFINSRDGLVGKSLFDYADKSIKLASYTEKAALQYFSSGMRLTGILSTDAPRLNDKQRSDLRNNYLAGVNSENGIAVLENGMKFEQLSNNAKDAQLIDTRQYNVQEAARWLTMAPTILGDFSHNIYGTIEAGSLDFITNSCGPYVIELEQEMTRKLLTPQERKKYYISLNEEALIKSDRTTYANYISTLLDKGVISINDARKMINMPSIEDGDSYIIPYSGTTNNPSYNNSNQLNNQNNQNNNSQNINHQNKEEK